MQNELLAATRNLIENEGYACVVIKDGKIAEKIIGRGIKPVMQLYEANALEGAAVADKVIGKASAVILSMGKVSEVYGAVMSEDAAAWFADAGIPFEAGTVTKQIMNRTLTGMCPMEMTVKELSDPEEMVRALKAKIAELSAE